MTEVPENTEKVRLEPFLYVAAGWLVVLVGLSVATAPAGELTHFLAWDFSLWCLCLFDLFALMKTIVGALKLMSATLENRGPLLIQTSFWGMIKIACLGIFTVILIKGQAIPTLALLLGVGTLVVVPLVGGYWWSLRI